MNKMSNTKDVNNSCKGDSECHVQHECKLSEAQELLLKENYPDVLDIIYHLYKSIEKQNAEIQQLKLKKSITNDVGTQTDELSITKEPKKLSEEIKEAAEMAMLNTGFVYEETSGLYYDYNSGYYYNAELGLYYDGNTGTYMTYCPETQSYEFHSQVDVESNTAQSIQKYDYKRSKRKKKDQGALKGCKRERSDKDGIENYELEEGECSDSSGSNTSEDSLDESEHADIARGWPPCMRIIVKSTEVPSVKEGALYIVTCEGGTLGREGSHAILISDINISKHHLKFIFNKEVNHYQVIDLGSRNGTLLNGKRISASKQESEPMEVVHGSHLEIGSTVLLCHIHYGNETCGHCEPGLLQTTLTTDNIKNNFEKIDKNKQHKDELRKLRKKFGIVWSGSNSGSLAEGYTDRAEARRQTVGSHNEHEKTQVASVDQSIGSENKGFQLLTKMGWSEGQSLGKDGIGLLNPVEVVSTVGTTGIGYSGSSVNSIKLTEEKSIWEKTQKRYQGLSELELPSSD